MGKQTVVKVGDKFNRWEVLSEVFYKTFPSGTKAKFVECRCDCGTIAELRLGTLTSPSQPSVSCGCLRTEVMEKFRDFPMIGESFGRLCIVSDGYREGRRSYIKVQCCCGSDPF